MTPTSDLFFLIQSLTKNEKGYFKKFVQTHQRKDSNYILLFNAIEKMEVYDEQKLKITFKSYSFIIQLAKYKNYLYQLILKSLRSFYSASNIDRILLDGLNDINLLYEKGLIKQSKKLLQTLKAKAILNQKTTYLYHFYYLEITLNQALHEHEYISKDVIQSCNDLNKEHITTISIKLILNDLYILTLKKGIEKDYTKLNIIKTKLDLLKKKDGKYFSFSTQLDFLNAYGIIYRAQEKHKESIKSCIEATSLIEKKNEAP